MLWTAVLGALAVAGLQAQPRTPELFGSIGVGRLGGDEGWLGASAVVGGSAMIPIRPKLAVDLDITHYVTVFRHATNPSASLVWRTGNPKHYFFIGGGAGGQFESRRFDAGSGTALLFRTGGVATIRGPVLFRTDFTWSHRYVLPNISLRAGIGYRFGR
ncbi:MAG: hypothetical protein FJW39_03550 [Acidobacteria bacterium]|nr:hypothetical protein [Acidobacteriota bacterium]